MNALSLRVVSPPDDEPASLSVAALFDEAERLYRANFPRAAAVALRCCVERFILDLYDANPQVPAQTGWRANRLKRRIQQIRQAKLIEAAELAALTVAVTLGDRGAHGERIDREEFAEVLWQVAIVVE